jgi:hypothetical protein
MTFLPGFVSVRPVRRLDKSIRTLVRGPAWAGHEPDIRFSIGARALHEFHITIIKWEYN